MSDKKPDNIITEEDKPSKEKEGAENKTSQNGKPELKRNKNKKENIDRSKQNITFDISKI